MPAKLPMVAKLSMNAYGFSSAVALAAVTALSLIPMSSAHAEPAVSPAAQIRDRSSASAERAVSPAAAQIRYMNGGIGEEQADLMRQMSAEFPVRFTFSQHNPEHNTDEFVADVRLRVVDEAGRAVLDLVGQGPIFLLSLPNGMYTVEAEHEGQVKTRRFRLVGNRRQEIGLSWPG